MSEEHHALPIKTPAQLVAAIIAGFGIPIVIIVLLAYYADNSTRTGAGTDSLSEAAVNARIAPLAQVSIRDANAPRVYKTGEQVYKAVCFACHATGAAGAPKLADTAAWSPRIAQGFDTLWHTALTGKGAMPPRGGTSPDDYSDYEIGLAVAWMANGSGAKFTDPPPPAAGAQGASSAAPVANTAAPSGADAQAAAAVAALAGVPQTAAPAAGAQSADAAQAGKALYQQVCQACHATGVLNAPKFGDKTAWAPRLKDPVDTIYNYALHGKGAMPPKGGSNASDADVKAAVDYMLSAAR